MFRFEASIFHGLLAGPDGAVDDRLNQLFKLFPRNLALITLAAGQFDVEPDRRLRRERNLGCDHGLANGLYSFGIAAKVDTHVAPNVVERDGDQQVVDIVAAKMGVTVSGDDLEDSIV